MILIFILLIIAFAHFHPSTRQRSQNLHARSHTRSYYNCCGITDFSKIVATVSLHVLEIHEILLSSLRIIS